MDFINQLRYKAKLTGATIVLPETEDIRTLKAAALLVEEGISNIILIGEQETIEFRAEQEGLALPDGINYLQFTEDPYQEKLADYLYNRRKHKGITTEQAYELLKQPLFYAAALVGTGRADGCVAGAMNTTGDVLRAAIQVIGLKPDSNIVSSVFLMHTMDEKVLTYADCAVVPYPDVDQLATIAADSADTHQRLIGEVPRVAMLSFSTKGSARHERSQLVIDALEIVQKRRPELKVDGELQFDAAYVPQVGERKAPGSEVAGQANVFIFPNIDAGNIAYKITERLAGASATGPIIQGLNKPMNDLSRGCTWEDIVNTVSVTALSSPKAEEV